MRTKRKSPIRERIRRLEAGLLGNRLNFLGSVTVVAGIVLAGTGIYSSSQGDVETGFTYYSSLLAVVVLGITLKSIAEFGRGTVTVYEKTKRHINRRGSLDPRFIEGLTKIKNKKYGEDCTYNGYCELQGAYLAARESSSDAVNVFREAKKTYSHNRIPNI